MEGIEDREGVIHSRARLPLKTSCQGLECGFGGKAACGRVVPWLPPGSTLVRRVVRLPLGARRGRGLQRQCPRWGWADWREWRGVWVEAEQPALPASPRSSAAGQPSGVEESRTLAAGTRGPLLQRLHVDTRLLQKQSETVRD